MFDVISSYQIDVSFPFGELDNMITWCENNCTGVWKFGDSSTGYTFYFEEERDYFTFLIWNSNENINISQH